MQWSVVSDRWLAALVLELAPSSKLIARSLGTEDRNEPRLATQTTQGEKELIAAKEVGANMRRQDRQIPARASAPLNPANLPRNGPIQTHDFNSNYSPVSRAA